MKSKKDIFDEFNIYNIGNTSSAATNLVLLMQLIHEENKLILEVLLDIRDQGKCKLPLQLGG